jgi:hypothetical protein
MARLDQQITEVTRPIRLKLSARTPYQAVDRCVAEVGADMKPFLTHQNLASWAGMCPGNGDSAGKRRRRGK